MLRLDLGFMGGMRQGRRRSYEVSCCEFVQIRQAMYCVLAPRIFWGHLRMQMFVFKGHIKLNFLWQLMAQYPLKSPSYVQN